MKNLIPFFILLVFSFASTAQTIIFVDSAATGLNDGSSWINAYTDLQPALEAAQPGEQIWVAKGTYIPSKKPGDVVPLPGVHKNTTFEMRDSVKLFGGFAGGETNLSQRDWRINKTKLYGGPNSSPLLYRSFTVVSIANIDSAAALDGFIIANGNNFGPAPYVAAGGITLHDSHLKLSNLIVRDNRAGNMGGGMYIEGSSSIISNVLVTNNVSISNQAMGGGIAIEGGKPLLIDVVVRGNTAQYAGAGGVYLMNTRASLINVLIDSNESTVHSGGGLYVLHGYPILINCQITNNGAGASGGGIRMYSNFKATFHNVTISGNKSPVNSALHNSGGNNIPPHPFYNSIIDGEISLSFPNATSFSNCMVSGSGGSVNWNSNFGVDGGNNLDTIPFFRDSAKGDFRLAHCSPLVGAGRNLFVPRDKYDLDGDNDTLELIAFDLGGDSRLIGSKVDIGAYEYFGSSVKDTLTRKLCINDSLTIGDTTISTFGIHTVYVPRAGKCDSIVVVDISRTVDATLATTPDSLTFYAVDSGASYQWYDCLNNYVLPTDTNQSFTPWIPSSYQVIVTRDGCADTSACIVINKVSLEEMPLVLIADVYPNPSTGIYQVKLPEPIEKLEIEVIDFSGHSVLYQNYSKTSNAVIDLSHKPAGIYILKITSKQRSNIMRLVKYY